MPEYTNVSPDGFAVIEVKCPSCGAPLRVYENASSLTCSYCDSSFHVSFRKPDPVETGIDADGSIRDKATGQGLFRAVVAGGWHVNSADLCAGRHSTRPYTAQVLLSNDRGGALVVYVDDAGQRLGGAIKAMMTMYGGNLAGVDRTNYADMPDPVAEADKVAAHQAGYDHVSNMRFICQLPCENLNEIHRQATETYQQIIRADGGTFEGAMAACVMRIYEYFSDGAPQKMAVYVRLTAAKFGLPATMGLGMPGMGGLDGLGDAFSGIADKIGSLFGKGKNNPPAQAPFGGPGFPAQQGQFGGPGLPAQQAPYGMQGYPGQQMMGAPGMGASGMGAPGMAGGVQWSIPNFYDFNRSGSIAWSLDEVAYLLAPRDDFDAEFKRMFVPFTESVQHHPDFLRITQQATQQAAAQIQQRTNTVIAQQQQAFQAQQQAMRERQAAFDSYIDSVQQASDRHHQEFRRRSNEMFDGGSYSSGSSGDWSEAIRGVNTFVTSDGREVELSVSSDVAYENQAGDVVGGPSHFDPGADWTQISRK